jgi:hypothetical protein
VLTRSTAGFRAARVAADTAARFHASGDETTAARWAYHAAGALRQAMLDREAGR